MSFVEGVANISPRSRIGCWLTLRSGSLKLSLFRASLLMIYEDICSLERAHIYAQYLNGTKSPVSLNIL